MINTSDYNFKKWREYFPCDVDMSDIPIFSTWHDYFQREFEKGKFVDINKQLTIENNSDVGEEIEIFPYPDLVFNSFNQLSFDDIRVVILGQDPYPKAEFFNSKKIPQAIGSSFSVPVGMNVPSSLSNIFKNQIKNNVITRRPTHGNLYSWEIQGCLMLNTALTVRENSVNSHSILWQKITDDVIKYISKELNDVVFMLWGGNALKKFQFIDKNKHKVIMSSHPSGLSYSKPIGKYPPFSESNHFDDANNYLTSCGYDKIIWQYI